MEEERDSSTGSVWNVIGFLCIAYVAYYFGWPYVQSFLAHREMVQQEKTAPSLAEYKQRATPMNYRDGLLEQYPKGKLLEADGKVFEVEDNHDLLAFIKKERYFNDYQDNAVEFVFSKPVKLMSGDILHVFGRYGGTETGTGLLGQTIKNPVLKVDYFTVEGKAG